MKLQKFKTYNPYEIWWTLLHSALHQFNLECCKSSVHDMGPNTLLKIKKIIIRRLKSEITKFPTYNPYEIWWTTCYHSPLHGTIQFGVLQ